MLLGVEDQSYGSIHEAIAPCHVGYTRSHVNTETKIRWAKRVLGYETL